MRKLLFLLPGTTQQFFAGGLTAELKTLKLAQQICQAQMVTYRQREKETLFLDDVLSDNQYKDCIFVVSWGFDVPKLIQKLAIAQRFTTPIAAAMASPYQRAYPLSPLAAIP